MTAGRMAGRHHAIEIEWVLGPQRAEVFGSMQDVVESPGPAAPGIPDAPVLDIPGGEAGSRQGSAQMTCVLEIVRRAPESAVDEDDDGMGAFSLRQAQIAELEHVLPVGNPCVRFR